MAIQHINQPAKHIHISAGNKRAIERFFSSLGDLLLNYWAHVIMIVLGVLVLIAIAVPFLSYLGMDAIAKPLFFALHYVCAQIPSHSFYVLGHQLGLCARNFSIYAAMFLGSVVFVVSKKRLPGIPWWVWVLMIVPIALDGTTQMFGLRESTWYLRVITGTLFGLGNVWFALPMMQKAILDTPAQVPMPGRPYAMMYQQKMAAASSFPAPMPLEAAQNAVMQETVSVKPELDTLG